MAGPGLGAPDSSPQGEPGGLATLLGDFAETVLPRARRYTDEEVATESGTDLELTRRLRRAMGLPDVAAGERGYLQADVDALRRVRRLVEMGDLADEDLLHMARTLGLAAARMADAVVGFWTDRITADARLDLLEGERVDELEQLIGYLFRRHLLDAVSRFQAALAGASEGPPVAVAFADLVGFTSLSEQLSDLQTADLVERFEVLATDLVVGGGGRVVKMIGDEVMFSAAPDRIADIALALAETFASPDLPSVRVGAASGSVLSLGGDLFGPVVNLAQRATVAARPGTVLVSPALAEMLADDPRYRVAAIRPHRLKGIGVVRLAVLRRA
ncbi:MAG: adenylate/guanylate cyclase domain-containing protein [Acidobacteriota bacterium]|nr:adenylate/guanylate cyclase domain-containing protein [Acidobacteriota bacterium]